MSHPYDVAVCRRLMAIIAEAGLHRTHAPKRYDPGHVFDLEVTGVCPAATGRAQFEVERYVGSGFAGQVYRVRVTALDLDVAIHGLTVGGTYAVKINVPQSGFARWFRDTLYWIAFQSAFAYRVNAAAARAGVLWQKLVRRAAAIRFQDDGCVADTYATFFDPDLGSFGEINEWVDGRFWRFEIDDDVFGRRKRTPELAEASREYLAKKEFMAELVRLLHEMGARELARQYEWWTAKSQPNVVKRTDADDGDAAAGLTALDFRAGLALLPCLPMSPADVGLIAKGLARGAWVQFDRCDLAKLEAFCDDYPEEFADLRPALAELKALDPQYRAAQPDLTHHRTRLLKDPELQHCVKAGIVQGWKVRGLVDEPRAWRLTESLALFWVFYLVGCLPVVGARLQRYWGDPAYARHVRACLTSLAYLRRTLYVYQVETLLEWYRDGRVDDAGVERLLDAPVLFWRIWVVTLPLPLSAKWQRFLTEWGYAAEVAVDAVTYPIRFYRDADFRVEWLTDEVEDGADGGMLTNDEKDRILARVPDPFIQKYLKCVAVHLCTLPVTQVVAAIIALYAFVRIGTTWQESILYAAGVLAFFQVIPISPGSLARGTYVVYLMVSERNWRNYWLAALVSFWHYIGYLGFPLQMVREFPALARFMAGRWATRMVRLVPVFGESGALLEHWIFDTFFNVPLSIKRRLSRGAGGPP